MLHMPVNKWPASEPQRVICLDKVPLASLLLFISSPNSRDSSITFFLTPKKIPPRELGDQQRSVWGRGGWSLLGKRTGMLGA